MLEEKKENNIDWLKKSLGWYCIFCNVPFRGKKVNQKELMTLPICGLCLSRYRVISDRNITLTQKELINNWFSNHCYLCEKQQTESLGSINGFSLCKSSCYQRYQVVSGWEEKKTV